MESTMKIVGFLVLISINWVSTYDNRHKTSSSYKNNPVVLLLDQLAKTNTRVKTYDQSSSEEQDRTYDTNYLNQLYQLAQVHQDNKYRDTGKSYKSKTYYPYNDQYDRDLHYLYDRDEYHRYHDTYRSPTGKQQTYKTHDRQNRYQDRYQDKNTDRYQTRYQDRYTDRTQDKHQHQDRHDTNRYIYGTYDGLDYTRHNYDRDDKYTYSDDQYKYTDGAPERYTDKTQHRYQDQDRHDTNRYRYRTNNDLDYTRYNYDRDDKYTYGDNKYKYTDRTPERYTDKTQHRYQDQDRHDTNPYRYRTYEGPYYTRYYDDHDGKDNYPKGKYNLRDGLQAPIVKSLLKISNTLRCGARNQCQDKCTKTFEGPKLNQCEDKCEQKFECEEEEEDPCADSENDSCGDHTGSTQGEILVTEKPVCPRCKK